MVGTIKGATENKMPVLRDYMKPGTLTLLEKLQISLALTNELAELHDANTIFGAVNPENILPEESGEKVLLKKEARQSLAYTSPEQTGRLARTPDTRTDLYSLGIVMYELLTGVPPFTGSDDMELVHSHIAVVPPSPKAVDSKVPEVLSAIIMKLLEKTPDARYQTAAGLAADVQNCIRMLQDQNSITAFTIGIKDFPNRIFIPQKLYGRESQLNILLNAYETAATGQIQVVFISGYSGIGKSALIQELHKPVAINGGVFLSGKYDQFRRDIPYTALLQALQHWIGFVLSGSTESIFAWRQKLIAALGEGASVLLQLVPELQLIMGPQPPSPVLSPAEAQNRFQLLMLRLITVGASGPHPLLLFIDDLQWADIPSLNLLQFILADTLPKKLCIVASYRSNEVSNTHPLYATIEEVRGLIPIHEIILSELDEDCIKQIVADILHCPKEKSSSLAKLIYSKTAGNPFFTNEFIKSLANDGLISFDHNLRQWAWDAQKISDCNITDNVAELMIGRLNKLSALTLQTSRFAACLGNTFSLRMLAAVNEKTEEETAIALNPMLAEGLIVPGNSDKGTGIKTFSFLHDRVQQAAIATLPEADRAGIHLITARAMWRYYNHNVPPTALFDIVNQYNLAASLIQDAAEKKIISSLAFAAGHRAKSSAAFEPAYRYFKMALLLLQSEIWSADYPFALALYNEAAEMAYLSGDMVAMEQLTETVFAHGKTVHDTVQAYSVRINAYTSLARNIEALDTSLTILKKLAVRFPVKPNKGHIIFKLISIKLRLRGKTINSFEELPAMSNQHYLAVMNILAAAISAAYFVSPNLFPLIIFKEIELSLRYGISPHSAFSFATYGIIMCGSTQEFDEGLKYAAVARSLVKLHKGRDQEAKITFVEENFIRHWREPYMTMKSNALQGFHIGMETGDFLYAGYNIFNYSNAQFYSGFPLLTLNDDLVKYVATLRSLKQNIGLGWLTIFKQTAFNLSDPTVVNTLLVGDDYNEAVMIPIQEHGNDYSGLCVAWMCKSILSYLLTNDAEEALKSILKSEQYLEHILATPHVVHVHFYSALCHMRSVGSTAGISRNACLQKVKAIQKKMRKWMKGSPENLSAKVWLIDAEMKRVEGGNAAPFYQTAVEKARISGYIHEEALANELLGKYYISQNEHPLAVVTFTKALELYNTWGARAKVLQMKAHYPFLQQKDNSNKGEKAEENIPLDLQSILKASQTISGEVQLTSLLQKLSQIIIENAGATSGFILLKNKQDVWCIAAQAGTDMIENIFYEVYIPVQNSGLIAESVVNYVLSTREAVVLKDAHTDAAFMHDAFITGGNARSLLCFPVLRGGAIIAIIYLQNTLLEGAFTKDRLQGLNLLSGQIAISIQNSILYDTLEQKVEERTAQLQTEKKKSDDLLLNILPAEIAEELKQKGEIEACQYDHVTVLFTDFVNFTGITETLSPQELVDELHQCFKAFDIIIGKYGLEKIKTIGDAYMAVCGLPVADLDHAKKTVRAAIEIREFIKERLSHKKAFKIRIGINSGSVVAGIVGMKKFAYDIWGDTVNVAARMEQNAEAGTINISQSTFELVKNDYRFKFRGKIPAKNKGEIEMYFVETMS